MIDSETGEPISEANIFIEGKELGVVTDSLGNFSLRVPHQMENDSVTCTVRYPGYEHASFTAMASKTPAAVLVKMEERTVYILGAYWQEVEEREIRKM